MHWSSTVRDRTRHRELRPAGTAQLSTKLIHLLFHSGGDPPSIAMQRQISESPAERECGAPTLAIGGGGEAQV